MYTSAKFGRFTEGKWPRGPPPSWVEVIYVIPLYGVSRGINLNLSSVGGRSVDWLLLSWGKALPCRPSQDRGKTVWGRGEAEPAKKTASRPPRVEADASRTTSLILRPSWGRYRQNVIPSF